MEWIQVCSNEGPCPSSRGDDSEKVNFYWKYLKTTQPVSTKLNIKHPWVEKNSDFFQIKSQCALLERERDLHAFYRQRYLIVNSIHTCTLHSFIG